MADTAKIDLASIKALLGYVDDKEQIEEQLRRLKKMYGSTKDGRVKCEGVTFHSSFTADCNAPVWDPEYLDLMVATAITYWEDRLNAINLLVGLAASVLDADASGVKVALEKLAKAKEAADNPGEITFNDQV